jgi:hypothetical protein
MLDEKQIARSALSLTVRTRSTGAGGKLLRFREPNRMCSICEKCIPLEELQTDERGNFVHEPCLATRSSFQTDRNKASGQSA